MRLGAKGVLDPRLPSTPATVPLPRIGKVYAASSLPHTPMSGYLESRVRNLLTELGEGTLAPTCHVREISNVKVSLVNEIDAPLESSAPTIPTPRSTLAP